jgi:hypothetical protein
MTSSNMKIYVSFIMVAAVVHEMDQLMANTSVNTKGC